MTVSRHPQITEELLSAYLDNEVTAEERTHIETAMATDPAIAWQVETLRQTVQLLQALPPLALPRSFTLEAIVAETQNNAAAVTTKSAVGSSHQVTTPRPRLVDATSAEAQPHWWQWLLQIWQGGNVQLRNATAVAFTLLIVLFTSNQLVAPYQPVVQSDFSVAQVTTTAPTVAPFTAAATATPSVVDAVAAKLPVSSTDVPTLPATNEVIVVAENAAETDAMLKTPGAAETMVAASQSSRSMAGPGEDLEDLSGGNPPAAQGQLPAPTNGSALDMSSQRMQNPGPENSEPAENLASVMAESSAVTTPVTTTVREETPAPDAVAKQVVTETEPVPAADAITGAESATTTVTLAAEQPSATSDAILRVKDQQAVMAPAADGVEKGDVPVATARWLGWAQMIAALSTIVLGALWWRSRG